MKYIKNNKSIFIYSAVLIIFFAVLSALFPYSGDDWAWGTQVGLDRLQNFFKDYNGRYAGNFLILLLSRVKFLRVIIEAASLFALCYIPYRFAAKGSGKNKMLIFLFSTLILFIVPSDIFTQSFTWASGFANYVPPIIITSLYFITVDNIFDSDTPRYSKITPLIMLFASFVGSLFMENITIFNVAVGVIIVVFVFIRFKKICLTHISFLLGSLIGTAVMFSNSAYRSIFSGSDVSRYQSVGSDTPFLSMVEHADTVMKSLISNNIAFCIIASVLGIILFCLWAKNSKDKKKLRIFGIVTAGINTLSLFISLSKARYGWWDITVLFHLSKKQAAEYNSIFFIVVSVLYFLSLLALSLIGAKNRKERFRMLIVSVSIPLIAGPLLFVSPIGPRCFYPIYFMMTMLFVLILSNILKYIELPCTAEKCICVCIASAIVGMSIFYFSIYSTIAVYDSKNAEYISKQKEDHAQTMVICKLPYNSHIWCANPVEDVWSYRYKLFYGIDENVELEIKTYSEFDRWSEKYDKTGSSQ